MRKAQKFLIKIGALLAVAAIFLQAYPAHAEEKIKIGHWLLAFLHRT
jgi:hypothetical protein